MKLYYIKPITFIDLYYFSLNIYIDNRYMYTYFMLHQNLSLIDIICTHLFYYIAVSRMIDW